MGVNEILKSALELPIDERVIITDLLTNSLNNIDSDIEKSWIEETNRRLDLLDKGELKTVSYEEFLMKIEFSQLSKNDFTEAIIYYKKESESLSQRFKSDIKQSINRIVSFPKLYPKINERVQKCIVSKFPFTIFYTIKEDVIYILAISNHYRDYKKYEDRLK